MENSRPLNTFGAAALVGASTFVPLPLIDDWIASLSRRQLVASTLRRHGRSYAVSDLKHLYDDGGSILGLPWRLAKGIILAPLNALKKMLLVFAARDLALAVGKTIALGHTLERELALGAFRNDDSTEKRRDDAKRLRKALDAALADVDVRVLQRTTAAVIARTRKKDIEAGEVEVEVEGFLAELDRRVDQALADIR